MQILLRSQPFLVAIGRQTLGFEWCPSTYLSAGTFNAPTPHRLAQVSFDGYRGPV
jgi:hypothetical protein